MPRWLIVFLRALCLVALLNNPALVHAIPQDALPRTGVAPGSEFDYQDELSPEQEQAMLAEIRRNVAQLRLAGVLAVPSLASVTYGFPLRLAPGLPDYAGFRVSAFADHNAASGPIVDYNGGTRTYDGHRGTDYALWPFSWNKLDEGAVQVVAAAAGVIAYKANVDATDHNCNVSSSDPWNYIGVVHTDGRLTLYGHMRYNSLTSKGIGASVAQGEYLGTVASSGNSSGPHLHFEVRYGGYSNAEWIDPYAGPNSQPESLWASQRPYLDSAINRLATHTAPPSTPDTCQPTLTNLADSFTTPRNIYFYVYYRDYQAALATQLKLYRPDGSLFQSAQYAPGGNAFYSAWSYGWVVNFSNSEPAGTWRFEATYNGQLYETFFNVNAPTAITVSGPNGGEQVNRLLPYSITWNDNLGGAVNIALYRNGVYSTTVVSNTPSDGEYLWTPGPTLLLSAGYKIRVISVINPAVYDESDGAFTLTETHLTAHNDWVLAPSGLPVTIDVLENDDKPLGEVITLTALSLPVSGTASIVNSQVLYTPTTSFFGSDVFTYTVNTASEQSSASVTVMFVNQVLRLFLPIMRR